LVVAAGFERAAVAEFFQAPFAVVEVDEGGECGGEFRAVFVGVSVDDLLLEGAVEAFDDAVGLGLTDEGEAGSEAVKATLPLEVVGEVLAAVVVAEFDAAGDIGEGGTEDAHQCLGDRFVGGEAVAAFADMVAEQLAVPVLDGGEHPQAVVLAGPHLRPVGRPAHVGRVGADASVVRLGGAAAAR
jgi:hypothetical protein